LPLQTRLPTTSVAPANKNPENVGMKKTKHAILATIMIVFATSISFAGESKATQRNVDRSAVKIKADTLVFNQQAKEATATGSVVITTPDGTTIKTDEAVLTKNSDAVPLIEQVKFNYGTLQTLKDSDLFLYILTELKKGETSNVEKFLEYQLDEVVKGLHSQADNYNKAQSAFADAALQSIKQYRLEHPRNFNDRSDPTSVSRYLMEESPEVPLEAARILKEIEVE
jgi:hypothetical protein